MIIERFDCDQHLLNLLAHPEAGNLLEEMASRDLWVNFTQTLDIRLLDRETARILRRIRCTNTAFTRTTYDRAMESLNAVNDEIAGLIRQTWGRS